MKWILFTGSWRTINKEVENDVRTATREVLSHGDGIVTGGTTGVDFFAIDEAMKLFPDASRLKVIIPAFLNNYIINYRTNWCKKPITDEIINNLEKLLVKIIDVNPSAVIQIQNDTIIDDKEYLLRNTEEVKISDEVFAFQINNSFGTQDTIDKAINAGLPISLYKKYNIYMNIVWNRNDYHSNHLLSFIHFLLIILVIIGIILLCLKIFGC